MASGARLPKSPLYFWGLNQYGIEHRMHQIGVVSIAVQLAGQGIACRYTFAGGNARLSAAASASRDSIRLNGPFVFPGIAYRIEHTITSLNNRTTSSCAVGAAAARLRRDQRRFASRRTPPPATR